MNAPERLGRAWQRRFRAHHLEPRLRGALEVAARADDGVRFVPTEERAAARKLVRTLRVVADDARPGFGKSAPKRVDVRGGNEDDELVRGVRLRAPSRDERTARSRSDGFGEPVVHA